MYAFVRKQGLQVLNRIDKVVLFRFVCHLRSVQIPVPERIVTQADDIKIHLVIAQLTVVITVIPCIRRSVGMNDDLCIRAFFAHRIASGFQQP